MALGNNEKKDKIVNFIGDYFKKREKSEKEDERKTQLVQNIFREQDPNGLIEYLQIIGNWPFFAKLEDEFKKKGCKFKEKQYREFLQLILKECRESFLSYEKNNILQESYGLLNFYANANDFEYEYFIKVKLILADFDTLEAKYLNKVHQKYVLQTFASNLSALELMKNYRKDSKEDMVTFFEFAYKNSDVLGYSAEMMQFITRFKDYYEKSANKDKSFADYFEAINKDDAMETITKNLPNIPLILNYFSQSRKQYGELKNKLEDILLFKQIPEENEKPSGKDKKLSEKDKKKIKDVENLKEFLKIKLPVLNPVLDNPVFKEVCQEYLGKDEKEVDALLFGKRKKTSASSSLGNER